MPFGLKNAPSKFQKIMNEIFNFSSTFTIVYIDDVLVFLTNVDQHFKHLYIFFKMVKQNGLVISQRKIKLFQTSIQFLEHQIFQGQITPINWVIKFMENFSDKMIDKTLLQRFLGCLNYISDYYKNLAEDRAILTARLKKIPP